MQCVCGGRTPACDQCGGTGRVRIERCPKKIVSADTWNLCHLSDLMETAHALPVAGGILDQTHSFNQALAFLRADEATFEADRNRKTDPHGE